MSNHSHVWGESRGAITEFGCCLSQYCACGAARHIEGPHGQETIEIVENDKRVSAANTNKPD